LNALLAGVSRSEDDDQALIQEAEELHREAQAVIDPEKKRRFLDRLDVQVVVERKAMEYWTTMSCILGVTKERILYQTSR
jgi:hypothetical protein